MHKRFCGLSMERFSLSHRASQNGLSFSDISIHEQQLLALKFIEISLSLYFRFLIAMNSHAEVDWPNTIFGSTLMLWRRKKGRKAFTLKKGLPLLHPFLFLSHKQNQFNGPYLKLLINSMLNLIVFLMVDQVLWKEWERTENDFGFSPAWICPSDRFRHCMSNNL